MNFTKEELLAIVAMCKRERIFMDQVESAVPGVSVLQAQANLAAVAAKAHDEIQELDKAGAAKERKEA